CPVDGDDDGFARGENFRFDVAGLVRPAVFLHGVIVGDAEFFQHGDDVLLAPAAADRAEEDDLWGIVHGMRLIRRRITPIVTRDVYRPTAHMGPLFPAPGCQGHGADSGW